MTTPFPQDCFKADSVKILSFQIIREKDGILAEKTTVLGLGDDNQMYYWSYESGQWVHYATICHIELDTSNGKIEIKEVEFDLYEK